MNAPTLLENSLNQATQELSKGTLEIPTSLQAELGIVLERCEAAKGVLTVILTSLAYKILHPKQDIRRHQSSIEGGYSGRTFDSHYITPFLKRHRFPAMAESGWLTRSLEQKVPYDKSYTGAIRPIALKDAFLSIIEHIEYASEEQLKSLLVYLIAQLVLWRERNHFSLAQPRNLSISQVLILLQRHFEYPYQFEGASRLPVLALYAVYRLLSQELKRFEGCTLLPLESHNSSDKQSGRMGDIDIIDRLGDPFEAVEIKYNIPIGLTLIETAYEKFMSTKINRYYILSTSPIIEEEKLIIDERIQDIKNIHGCQLIVNGIYTSLQYYLRLVNNPALFIEEYTGLLMEDKSIKYEHKLAWNTLTSEILR